MAQSRSVFLYCMAAALHNPALSSLVPRCRLALCRSLLRAENPNLPSVSPFRRMMDDAERDSAEGSTLLRLLSSADDAFQSERRANRAVILLLQCDETDGANTYARQFAIQTLMLEFIERYISLIYKLANSVKMC